jgi:Zn-dependent M28 family amino/carboxypeptidase
MNLARCLLSLLTMHRVLRRCLFVAAITILGATIAANASDFSDSMTRENTETQLRQHVFHLAGTIGERNVFRPQALHAAQEYIEATWRGQGYEIVTQAYSVNGVRSANLEVTRTGVRYPEQIILIGAHYDSVYGSPGANDNGSGVAALLELSRLLVGIEPDKSVRFVAFTNEEPPFYATDQQGSAVYARDARQRGDDIRFMVALETIGSYSNVTGIHRFPSRTRGNICCDPRDLLE